MNHGAFIFDLDGVLTETQELHKKAWELSLNELLFSLGESPFKRWEDYRLYLDGRPRIDGIRCFLTSRNLKLSEERIRALGERKNNYYMKLLEAEGPRLLEDSRSFIRKLFEKSVPMAVVSSSRNCRMILELTGLIKYFGTVIDPSVVEGKNLLGKPSPDYFLEACRELGVSPDSATIVEDAKSGIEAGVKGKFKKVVGLKTNGDRQAMQELKEAGAHEVVQSLWEIDGCERLLTLPHPGEVNIEKSFLFLDFDGTISAIVDDPSEARLLEGVRELIVEINKFIPVCVITGRDTEVIKKLIHLPEIYYAACHGFEISGPDNYHYCLEEAERVVPEFDIAEEEFTQKLGGIKGVVVERKTFGLAIHYRMVEERGRVPEIIRIVQDYSKDHPLLKAKPGEEVFELLPNLDWDKGKALLKLYEVLKLPKKEFPPIYLGDGQTDEDAFREMENWGVPILVSTISRPTYARFRLSGPPESRTFLLNLQKTLEKTHGRMDTRV